MFLILLNHDDYNYFLLFINDEHDIQISCFFLGIPEHLDIHHSYNHNFANLLIFLIMFTHMFENYFEILLFKEFIIYYFFYYSLIVKLLH